MKTKEVSVTVETEEEGKTVEREGLVTITQYNGKALLDLQLTMVKGEPVEMGKSLKGKTVQGEKMIDYKILALKTGIKKTPFGLTHDDFLAKISGLDMEKLFKEIEELNTPGDVLKKSQRRSEAVEPKKLKSG